MPLKMARSRLHRSQDRFCSVSSDCHLNYLAAAVCYNLHMKQLDDIPADWLADFEAASRRPLEQRMRYAFIRTYKPVLDDAPFRAFETTAEYRQWCEDNLPSWL